MTTRNALMRGAAAGALLAVCLGASAQAADQPSNRELIDQIQQLNAQVQALQARLDSQQQAQQATQVQVQQTQAQVQQVAADNESVQTRLADVPTQVLATIAEIPKPKPSWADSTSVSGRMYFDLSSISQKSDGVKTPPSGVGFDIKRFYVSVDHTFNSTFSADITTDFQYSSAIGATELYIKKAYLQANVAPELTLRFGAADMPWIPYAEGIYGYRHLEQTVSDRTKFGTSSDWGVHALGKLGQHISYDVAVINGGGYKNPTARSKTMDVEGRVSVEYQGLNLAVGGYSGKLAKKTEGAVNVEHTANRFNALAAYVKGPYRIGVEYFSASNWNNVTSATSDKSDGYSVFGSYNINPMISVFGRYDWVKPNKTTSPDKKDNYWNIGIQYEPVKIIDLALVYKRDRIDNGTISTGNGTIGGLVDGSYDEIGLFGQLRW